MIDSEKGLKILSKLPKDRILTETDGPYIKIGRRPAEPSDVQLVLAAIARAWDTPVADIESQVQQNFLSIPGRTLQDVGFD